MQNLLPITLGVRRKSDAEFSLPAKPPDPKSIWRKDDFTCRFCGFRAEKFQRTVPGAYAGEDAPALTACIFCEPCFMLETVGITAIGHLIWLPDMSQAELHHFCRAIYIAEAQKHEPTLAAAAKAAQEALLTRRADAKKRLGTDDPAVLGAVMLENMNAADYAARGKKLEGIRFLPLPRRMTTTASGTADQFPAILDYWMSVKGPFAALPVRDWMKDFAA